MDKLFEWLKGKKSYIVAIATGALGVIQGIGLFTLPDWAWPVLAALFGIALRDAVNSIADTVKPKP